MRDLLTPFLAGAGFVAACLVFFVIGKARGYETGYQAALNEPHKADTVWRTDTVVHERPVEKWRTVEKTVYIKVDSLITIHDTTFIAMEKEKKGYSGEDYECTISGIDPVLESISVYPKTAYVTNTIVEKQRWSWTMTAGPGAFWSGEKVQFGVGAVIGFGYNF